MPNIVDWEDFKDMSLDLTASYVLLNDLLTTTAGYETYAGPTANGNTGWSPTGAFSGSFDLDGYTIDGLNINRSSSSQQGIFGSWVTGASITNGFITNVDMTVGASSAVIAGRTSGTGLSVSNIFITGMLAGGTNNNIGPIFGEADGSGTIQQCATDVDVSGLIAVGGAVGDCDASALNIIDFYSIGPVTASLNCGGVVGDGSTAPNLTNAYAAGPISNVSGSGGLVGGGTANVVNSFWDTQTTGQPTSAGGGTGKTTSEMYQQATYTGWDFATVWMIEEGVSYPELQWAYVPSEAAIPNLSNLSLSAAQSAITSAGFLYGGASYTCTNDFPPDIVLTQSPNAGELRQLGSYIFVNVSCEDISTSSVLGREFTIKDQYGELIAAGITSKGFEVSNSPVDITSDDSEGWQSFMNKPGGKSVSLDIQGVFSDNLLKNYSMLGGNIKLLAVEINDTKNTLTGDFIVTAYSNAVAVNDAVRMSATLQLSGELY